MRTVAVLGVILYHTTWRERPALPSGSLGVNLFFVLSGFLITSILIGELAAGRYSYGRFLLRRALRLAPALLALVVISVLVLWGTHSLALGPSLAALPFVVTYTSNFAMVSVTPNMGWFAHTWSLSLEEQFYLLFPILLAFLVRKTPRTVALGTTLLLALLFAGLRTVISLHGRNGLSLQADSLLFGCAAAMVFAWSGAGMARLLPPPLFLGIGWTGAVLVAATVDHQNKVLDIVGYPCFSVLVAVTLLRLASTTSTRSPHRLLESRLMVYLGGISYGIYLWQLPVIEGLRELGSPEIATLVIAPISSVILATVSYALVERPFLRLKGRLASRRVPLTDNSVPFGTT